MNKADFFLNFVEYHTKSNFSFVAPDETFQEPKKLSPGQQTVIGIIEGAAFGIVGSLATGYFDKISKDGLIADLKTMNQYCDLAGISLAGLVSLRLAIDGDALAYRYLLIDLG